MNKTIKFLIKKKNNGERIDVFLSKEINYLTRSYLKKIIEKNNLKINNKINNSPSTKIRTDDKVEINILKKAENKLIPKD